MKASTIKTLIVGIDLSEYSKIVAHEAKQLAEQLDLPLVYVFAYEDVDLYEESLTLNRPKVTKLYENKIRLDYGVADEHKVLVRFGRADKEILDVAKKMKDPLIIVGHKGGHAVARFFLGSVAETLAATSPYPVWIHRGEKVLLPKKILVPSDLSKRSDKTIAELKGFKKAFNSDIEICHVIQEPFPLLEYEAWSTIQNEMRREEEKKIKAFRKKHPTLKTMDAQGTVADRIQDHAENFDLIAISPHEKTKTKTFLGSVTAKVVRSGDKPVLVVP